LLAKPVGNCLPNAAVTMKMGKAIGRPLGLVWQATMTRDKAIHHRPEYDGIQFIRTSRAQAFASEVLSTFGVMLFLP
jgi:hypothetical protein